MSKTVNLPFGPDDIKSGWRCAGCGVLSPNKERACNCPTGVVCRTVEGKREQAWKAGGEDVQSVVAAQANDAGLWFAPRTPGEDILQRALRRLHAAVEGKSSEQCAIEALSD